MPGSEEGARTPELMTGHVSTAGIDQPQAGMREAIESGGGAPEDVRLLGRSRSGHEALQGIQADAVGVAALVDGKIAPVHAAAGSEGSDAGVDPRAPRVGEFLRARCAVLLFEAKAAEPHAES